MSVNDSSDYKHRCCVPLTILYSVLEYVKPLNSNQNQFAAGPLRSASFLSFAGFTRSGWRLSGE